MEVSGRRCSRKEMCRTSQLHHQDTRWQDIQEKSKQLRSVEFEETSVEISDNENDNVDDENQVNNEKLEIKSENQPSPKTAVRTTRYGRVVKPPRRYDEYECY